MQLKAFDDLFDLVRRRYESRAASRPTDDRLAERGRDLVRWYDEEPQALGAAASACIERFLDAEFDYKTPGMRGVGRTTSQIPRLAARHRPEFRRTTGRDRSALRSLAREHVLCGYLFLRYTADLDTVPCCGLSSDELFRLLLAILYSDRGGVGVYPAEESLWRQATEVRVKNALWAIGVDPDDGHDLILAHYFEAGKILSLLEGPYFVEAWAGKEPVAEPVKLLDYRDRIDYRERRISKAYVLVNACLMAFVALRFADLVMARGVPGL
jgi:hypothetical protein